MFYGEDLAWVHDVGHTDFARDAAPWLLQELGRAAPDGGLVVDLGCGSGVWAAELTRAGWDALGFDISAPMIALARRKAPDASFQCASFLDAELPPCVGVTALGECLGYLEDGRVGRKTLRALFRRVRRALGPGGLFVFDVRGRATGPARRWREGQGWVVLVDKSEAARGRELVRRIVTFRRVGRSWRRTEEIHRLRLLDPAEVESDLRAAGFRVRRLRGYGDVRFGPGLTGFAARRR